MVTSVSMCLCASATNSSGCVSANKIKSGTLKLNSGEAIGQSFISCTDGFLSHFSFQTSDLHPSSEGAFINIYEVINNRFSLIHQENEELPDKLTAGKITFWISDRVPVYNGREYAVEFLNLSEDPFYISYSADDSYLLGSMIVNGKFTFSDLTFSVGIKNEFLPFKHEAGRIDLSSIKKLKESELFQSWSNKNIEIEYGDIGQSFIVTNNQEIHQLAVKIKNTKVKSNGVLEIHKGGTELKHLIHNQEFEFQIERGERWEEIQLDNQLTLEATVPYFISFKFENPDASVKFYYSTANPYENGDMHMGDLHIKDCDLSFFLQSNEQNFMKEIKWLEEHDYDNTDSSPLTIETEEKNKFMAQAFPNPFDRQFMLSYENMNPEIPVILAITNLSGTILWRDSFRLDDTNGVLNIQPEINFAPGKYNLRVSQEEQVVVSTLISK